MTFPTVTPGAEQLITEHDFSPFDHLDNMLVIVATDSQFFGLNAPDVHFWVTSDIIAPPTPADEVTPTIKRRWVHGASSPTDLVLTIAYFPNAPNGQWWVGPAAEGILMADGVVVVCAVENEAGVLITIDAALEQFLDMGKYVSSPSVTTDQVYNTVLRVGGAQSARLDGGQWIIVGEDTGMAPPGVVPSDADPIDPDEPTFIGPVSVNGTQCFGVTVIVYGSETGVVGPFNIELEAINLGPPRPQDYTAATAIAGAHVFGPLPEDPAELAAAVYRRPDLNDPIVTLDTPTALGFRDPLNDIGSGELTLKNDDPDLALIQFGDIVRFTRRGYAAFAAVITDDLAVIIDPNEEAGQATVLSGPGHLAIIDEARVYPARGLEQLPVEIDRLFNWAGLDYDDTHWRGATSMGIQSADSLWWMYDDGDPMPEDWPYPDAHWIWAAIGTQEWAPEGSCYFRQTFTVPEGVPKVRIYFTCDDSGQLYIDGQKVYDTDNQGNIPEQVRSDVLIDVTPGDHLIAVHGYNVADPEGDELHNPAGVLVAVFPVDATGITTSDTPLTYTDESWKIVEYPPFPPGMTIGEILIVAIEEAQARGSLLGLTPMFTRDIDSDGVPWTETPDVATKVGESYLVFARELIESYCDLWMAPAGLELHAWVPGGRGETRDITYHPPTDTTDPLTGNLQSLVHHTVVSPGDAMLVRWAGGWTERTDPDAVDTYGRRETLLSLGAIQSRGEAHRITDRQLGKFSTPRTAIEAGILPIDDTDTPYLAYRPGDSITVPGRTGPAVERVVAIGCVLEDGKVLDTVEFKDPLLTDEERFDLTLEKMADGTLRGDSKVATPVAQTDYPRPTCCPPQPPDGGGGGIG